MTLSEFLVYVAFVCMVFSGLITIVMYRNQYRDSPVSVDEVV